ncbi:MAG: D-aminoacylase [Nitrospirota bacterium]
MLDYIIKDGLVIDGSGAEPVTANVGIQSDRIAYIGTDRPDARETIEAKGLIVSPGFIDTHAHSEFTLLADGRAEGKIHQGVTTEINGNCGLSAAPLRGEAAERRTADLEELGIRERWSSFNEYLSLLRQKGTALNFATLCGHGNIRASVIGYKDRVPGVKELSEMRQLLAEAMREGAKGLSTGLIYPPGVYATTEELIVLSKSISSVGLYASHMRSEGDALIESITESIRIGEEADIPIHISHVKTSGQKNWGKIDAAIETIEAAQARGIRLTGDRYPYIAASTDLDAVLPSWVYEGGIEEELRRLRTSDTAERIRTELRSKDEHYWKGIFISSTVKAENKWMEGESLFDIARKRGKDIIDALFEILVDERARTGAIFFSMNEDNLRRFLSLPYVMIGSDSSVRSFSGPTCTGKPHPRGFGTFPRFIGRYVRDERLMHLPEAIRKMTSLPAMIFGLHRRGHIREGYYADLVVFDYERIIDKATFEYPYQRPEGVHYVMVNGILALKEGEVTGSRSGMIV